MADGIIIGGKERHFIANNIARKAFFKLTGKHLNDVSPSDESMFAPICWSMMVTEDPTLDFKSVEDEIDRYPFPKLMHAIAEASGGADPLPGSPAKI